MKQTNNKRNRTILILAGILLGSILAATGIIYAQSLPELIQGNLFVTSDQCQACHNQLRSPTGDDISIGVQWKGSMMANSARDPYWRASVRRETMDHPSAQTAIEDKCSTCHMPMARYLAKSSGQNGVVLANIPNTRGQHGSVLGGIAQDGVSCSVCHQIATTNLGTEESFTGGFVVQDLQQNQPRPIYGPYDINEGLSHLMKSATTYQPTETDHIRQSEFCATCHTLYTHALDKDGKEVGTLPEQVPYLEWKHSAYVDSQSCQICHMPAVHGATQFTATLGQTHTGLRQHLFRGGNALMLRILSLFSNELYPLASSGEMQTIAQGSLHFLREKTAQLQLSHGQVDHQNQTLTIDVTVTNQTGHKLPTAYPSRRVWLELVVTDPSGATIFESGRLNKDGSISGNANDVDLSQYEPHYDIISTSDQVQIYEGILATPDDTVTTGLMEASQYIKDNRLLPTGFNKTTASDDIAVHGVARDDETFLDGTDTITYQITVPDSQNTFVVHATLWYQSIGFRWAVNLADYEASETEAFVRMFQSLPGASTAYALVSIQQEVKSNQ